MKLTIREITVFAMYGALMYASKVIMEVAPNIHLIGVFTIALTVVYRKKALYPIYIFVLLTGLFSGFAMWWIPYLYLWAVLWGIAMLLPRKLPRKWQVPMYMVVCGLHGLMYGTLYAPAQMILFGLDWQGMIAWIIAGFPWDVVHGVGNLVCGLMIVPVIELLRLLEKQTKND